MQQTTNEARIEALEKKVADLEMQLQGQQQERKQIQEIIRETENLKKLLNEVADYNKGTRDEASQ